MILTEEVMKQLDNTEVRVDQVTTSFINYQGAHQMTVDTYVNGEFDFDESQCYDEGDEALPLYPTGNGTFFGGKRRFLFSLRHRPSAYGFRRYSLLLESLGSRIVPSSKHRCLFVQKERASERGIQKAFFLRV